MHQSLRRILIGATFFLITSVVAVMGYVIAGWTVLESVYMVVITIFGVGYGEVRPITSPLLRVFTIGVIVAGTTSAVYIVGGFVQMITEGEIRRAIGARRKMKEIESLTDHVIICGYGRIGRILSQKMVDARQAFVLIDRSSDRLSQAEASGYLVLNGDANDESVLLAAGIERARFLATALPDDASNVFITLTARGLNPNLTILARGEYPSTEKKLRQAGADHVVLPATIGALRMAHMITHPAALDFLEQNDGLGTLNELLARIDVQIDELVVPAHSQLVGTTISDLEVRGKGIFIVVAVRQATGQTLIHPDHRLPIAAGDTIIVMGHHGDLPKLAQTYVPKRRLRYRGSHH